MQSLTILAETTPSWWEQPQVIAAGIAGVVALVALVVNTLMAFLQYCHNRNQIAEAKRKESREHLRAQLDSFYGPLWHYLMTIKGLFKMFRSNKPKEFRALTYLLESNQKYKVGDSEVAVELTEGDRQLLAEILNIASKIESLVLDKAGLVDNSRLMTNYTPNAAVTDVNPNAFKDMGLLAVLLIHFRVLRLAADGKLIGELQRYKDFVYPRELDSTVLTHIEELREKLANS